MGDAKISIGGRQISIVSRSEPKLWGLRGRARGCEVASARLQGLSKCSQNMLMRVVVVVLAQGLTLALTLALTLSLI